LGSPDEVHATSKRCGVLSFLLTIEGAELVSRVECF